MIRFSVVYMTSNITLGHDQLSTNSRKDLSTEDDCCSDCCNCLRGQLLLLHMNRDCRDRCRWRATLQWPVCLCNRRIDRREDARSFDLCSLVGGTCGDVCRCWREDPPGSPSMRWEWIWTRCPRGARSLRSLNLLASLSLPYIFNMLNFYSF